MRIEYEREDKPMCNLGEAIYFDGVEKGIEQGIEQGRKEAIEQKNEIVKNIHN